MSLYRESGILGGLDDLFLELNGQKILFNGATYFPEPVDDFLLYLPMARSGLLVLKESGRLQRISASQLLRKVWDGIRVVHLNPVNVKRPDWAIVEMRVAAAFMTACNSGSLSGCSVEELVTRFIAELIDHPQKPYIQLKHLDKIEWAGTFRCPFIWPFNTEVPESVSNLLKTAESTRPSDSDDVRRGNVCPGQL